MKIKTKFALSSGLVAALSIAQLLLALLLLRNQRELTEAQRVQNVSDQLAQELRASSDDLTRLARTYVVTGERSYLDAYWKVLDVRDGKAPGPDGTRSSLRQRMKDIGFTDAEFAKLQEAEDNSNGLVATEVAAFKAMEGRFTVLEGGRSRDDNDYTRVGEPDPAFAIRIMHDPKYHQDKASIMTPIAEAETMVANRTLASVNEISEQSGVLIAIGVGIGFALVTLVAIAHLFAQRPVLSSTEQVQRELNEIASGAADLSRRLSVSSSDELGQLATALNLLMARLEKLISQVLDSGGHVNAATRRIAQGTKDLESTVAEQVAATTKVVGSAREISATSDTLARTMGEVSKQSATTAAAASRCREDLETMEAGMAEIESASKLVGGRLAAINDKARNITNVVGTITRVAEQTNLLSLNAAIEAEKAGQYGQGFSVVAREIRRLADQTAAATIDIERTVEEMRAAVDNGVATIDLFSARVRNSSESVRTVNRNMSNIAAQIEAVAPEFESVRRGMEAQSSGARQISETMTELSRTTRQTAQAIDDSRTVIEELNRATQTLQTEVSRLKVGGA